MKTSIKEFIAANKTLVIIGSVVVVFAAGKMQNNGFGQMGNGGYSQGTQYGNQAGRGYNNNDGGGNQSYNGYNTAGQGYNTYSGYSGGGYSADAGYGNSGYNNQSADITSGYYKRQAAQDIASENFSDYILDKQNYADADGNTYKLESGYNQGWINNNTNEYTLTNSTVDPNTTGTSSYTPITPVETTTAE